MLDNADYVPSPRHLELFDQVRAILASNAEGVRKGAEQLDDLFSDTALRRREAVRLNAIRRQFNDLFNDVALRHRDAVRVNAIRRQLIENRNTDTRAAWRRVYPHMPDAVIPPSKRPKRVDGRPYRIPQTRHDRFRIAWNETLESLADQRFDLRQKAERIVLAQRVVIMTWLMVEPDAHLFKPVLTDFQNWPWEIELRGSEYNQRSSAPPMYWPDGEALPAPEQLHCRLWAREHTLDRDHAKWMPLLEQAIEVLARDAAIDVTPAGIISESSKVLVTTDAKRPQEPALRNWTQSDLDTAIREYKTKRADRYSELVKVRRDDRPGSLKAAQQVFGRNTIVKDLGVRAPIMVSRSPAWQAIAEDLKMPLKRERATGTRHTRKTGKIGSDIAQEQMAASCADETDPAAPLMAAETAETLRLIKQLSPKEASALRAKYEEGSLTDEQARQIVRTVLSTTK